MKRVAILVLALLIGLVACTSESDDTTTSSPTTSVAVTSSTTSTTVTEPAPTETLDTQIEWVLAVLNGAPTDEGEIEERFSRVLLEYVPAGSFLEVVSQLRSTVSESWEVAGRSEAPGGATVDLDTEDGTWVLAISVDDGGQIETLLLSPEAAEITDPPESLDELAARLSEYGRLSMQVAEVSTGSCAPAFEVEPEVVRPIGSTFKLYVLGAVADAVARGDLAWDDEIAIRDDLKSLPSGTFQTRPNGSTDSLLAYAEAMISTSDNTATDHLMDLVGRDAVEVALVDYGNAHAELTRPFPTTRELFVLKLASDPEVVAAWVDGTEDERRALLEDPIAGTVVTIDDAVTWVLPRMIDEIEWFADAGDQCRVLAGLIARTFTPDVAEVRDILAINPGVSYDADVWTYVGYKGGSEPGVLNLAWYLERADGRAYTYVVNVTNPDAPLSEQEIVGLVATGLDLIGQLE